MAGKGGGAWKVAYADFVTAMMAFFMVMWLVGQNKEVKESVASYFKDPFAISRPGTGGGTSLIPSAAPTGSPGRERKEAAAAQNAPTAAEGATETNINKPSLFVLHDGDKANVGTVVLFDEYTSELSEKGRRLLDELAPTLVGKRSKIEIRGHSTRRPLPDDSPFKDSWELCYARCLATFKYLAEQGVDPQRFRLSQAGPFEPQTIRLDADWQTMNSRVEVYVLSEFVDSLQGTQSERDQQTHGQ